MNPFATFTDNYLKKLPVMVANNHVSEAKFSHCLMDLQLTGPSIIAGAGPSLDKNIETMKGIDTNKFWIFACDAAVKDLVEAGIMPHFIVASDPGAGIDRFFYPNNSILLHEASSRFEYFQQFERAIPFHLAHSITRIINNFIFGKNDPGLPAYGSVLNCAVSLAAHMGSNCIYLVGADYAYTGNRSHCKSWSREPYPEVIVPMDGTFIRTSSLFLSYAKWLEVFVKSGYMKESKVWNCTGGGILDLPFSYLEDILTQASETSATIRYNDLDLGKVAVQVSNLLENLYNWKEKRECENPIALEMIRYGAGYSPDPNALLESCEFFINGLGKFRGDLNGSSTQSATAA
jgi:hypothetical protein